MNNKINTNYISLIVDNIREKGFERYDPNDIKLLNSLNYNGFIWKVYRNIVLILEQFFPILLRILFKIKKTPFITAYTHVGEAIYIDNIQNFSLTQDIDIENICESMLDSHYISVENKWPTKPNNYFFPLTGEFEPTMHLHGLTRANILLLKGADLLQKKEYIDISISTLEKTLLNHFSEWYSENIFYVSYMYNSNDCTLNVNSEVAEWISLIPEEYIKEKHIKKFNGIVNLIITEQNKDGSWFYYSKEFSSKKAINDLPDSHHNATILYNMIHVLDSPYLEKKYKASLYESINNGIKYLIEAFFFEIDKGGYVYPNRYRKAGPVQYAESIIALCDYSRIEKSKLVESVLSQVNYLIPKLIIKLKEFIEPNGSVAGEKVLRWVNVDSIRWGNGPCLQALIKYEEWLKFNENE